MHGAEASPDPELRHARHPETDGHEDHQPRERSVAVTILAPAYNEEAVLEQFCRAAREVLGDDSELLIVDDGSSDATARIAAEQAARDARVRVVTHEVNRGLGGALATGFAHARGRVVVTLDADLSHPFALLPSMLGAAENADVVYASRFVPGGAMVGVPWWRAAISSAANRVLRGVFRTSTHDLTGGYRAYRATVLSGLDLRAQSFAAQLELTVRVQAAGWRVAEVPLVLRGRVAGTSKMRYVSLMPRYAALTIRLLGVRWLAKRPRVDLTRVGDDEPVTTGQPAPAVAPAPARDDTVASIDGAVAEMGPFASPSR